MINLKRLLPGLFFVFMLSCSKDEPDPAVEISQNSSMEAGSSVPAFWQLGCGGPGSGILHLWSADEASSGARSLKMSCPAVSSEFCFWSQYYANTDGAVSGKHLTMSVKVKGVALSGDGVSVAVRADGSSTASQFSSTQGNVVINGTFDWRTYEVTIPSVSADAVGVYVFLIYLPNTTGDVYFDEVSLRYK